MRYNPTVVVLVAVLLAVNGAIASPFYYFGEAVDQAQQAVQDGTQQAEQQVAQPGGALPQRIQGHLGDLLTHSGSAVKGVAESLRPDVSNIGKDLSEVYQVTRDNVNSRVVEPLTHTVRPYIDHAQKVVAPYVNQAKEEVPKLINQAGPALSKVGGQVRDGLSEVWSRISSATSGTGSTAQQTVQSGADQAASGAQQVVASGSQAIESGQQSATNAIQQGTEAIQKTVQ